MSYTTKSPPPLPLSLATHTVPLKMPAASGSASGSARGAQSSRSSRRRMGSSTPVLLGGGAGALGQRPEGQSSASPTTSTMSKSPTPSPTSATTVFYTPTLSAPSTGVDRRSTSPLLSPTPMPPPRPVRRPSPAGSSTPTMPPSSLPAGSNSSLSTASSSSSRTLKTPHSKLDPDYQSPAIASSSGLTPPSSDLLHRPKEEERSPTPQARKVSPAQAHGGQRSPTPVRRVEQGARRDRERVSPPAIATGPLPPLPTQSQSQSAPVPTRAPPPPLPASLKQNQETQHVPRLSQDWVHLNLSLEIPSQHQNVERAKSTSPLLPEPRQRLPDPMMIPLKNQSPPTRPTFERMHSAPLSPTRPTRPEYQSRQSMDHLRSGSPATDPRMRKTSFSTPPQAILDAATSSWSTEKDKPQSRLNIFRTANQKISTPPLRSRKSEDGLRKSEDMLRKSEDMLRPSMDVFSKKELKAMQKEAQRNLGVATPPPQLLDKEKDESRKSSGLSLKKSSGALKALFKSGKGKEKDKESTPSPPPLPEGFRVRSRTATTEGARQVSDQSSARPSVDDRARPSFGRSRTPNAPSSIPPIVNERERVPSDGSIKNSAAKEKVPSPTTTGRGSFSAERTLYPSNPRAATPTPARSEEDDSARTRKPSRDLPPLPMPTPSPSPSPHETKSFEAQMKEKDGEKKHSPLGEALPVSSLPYLSVMAGNSMTSPVIPDTSKAGPSTPPKPTRAAPKTPSPLFKPSRSLHLLSLPDLDLDFDLSFDKVNGSPSTPRRISPQKKCTGTGPASPSRSASISSPSRIRRPEMVHRTTSERRRSQSVDSPGPAPASVTQDSWFDLRSANKLLAATTSSSAPVLSKPLDPSSDEGRQSTALAPAPVEDVSVTQHKHTLSYSSQPSAPSSLDHTTTPSDAASSPSPPRTPVDERSSYPDFSMPDPDTTPVPLSSKSKALGEAITLSRPPSIPLPAVPAPAPAPAAVAVVEPIKSEKDKPELKKPRECIRRFYSTGRVISPELPGSNRALARDIDRLLLGFRYPTAGTTAIDRINTLKNELLPLLFEIEKRPYESSDESGNSALRTSMFEWSDALLFELQIEQSANERGACLEALSAVMESCCVSERALQRSTKDKGKFTRMMIKVVEFVMGKLGAKGVFHNTLLFSGRTLAFAFFRIPHIGEQLVTVLQPPRGALMRFTRTALQGTSVPASAEPTYPKHLLPLCFDNSRSYTERLARLAPEFNSEEERDAFLFQPGNWLRRWQSDDSELFPAFYRSYHRQLANYLAPAIEYYEKLQQPLPVHVLLRAPGYAHLATIFARKCHSYILGSVNAVTTSSTAQSFEATETAFRSSQKPPVLETANRRLVETISTFVQTRVMIAGTHGKVMEYDGSTLWTGIIDLWSKSIIQKTSLYAPKGVFSLFDLLDGIVDPPMDPLTGQVQTPTLDIPHLIYVVRLVLNEGEHALTLVKVIAFVFTHWEVLTADPEDRRELCLDILLQKDLFERLLLFWSQSVRSYVLRLVVFRLGHIHTKARELGHEVEIESVKLLQSRLESIKKRHDQLEPGATIDEVAEEKEMEMDIRPTTPVQGGLGLGLPRSRSTITMVTDSPSATSNKAERLMGLGLGPGLGAGAEEEKRIGGKATSWFKKLGKNKKKKDGDSSNGSSPSTTPTLLDSSPLMPPAPSLRGSSPLGTSNSRLPDVTLASPTTSSDSSEGDHTEQPSSSTSTSRKQRPPKILTHPPTTDNPELSAFSFEFELPTSSPRSDSFDPIPTLPPASPRRRSQPPSPSQAQAQPSSPHMSRSFSKRSSLLPPQTARELELELMQSTSAPRRAVKGLVKEKERGYDKRLHAYAIRMLAELEDAQKEYDEWWSEGGVGKVDGAPPRLTVAWPFHDNEE